MRGTGARRFILCCGLVLAASCDKKPPFAPDDDAALASLNGGSLGLSATAVSWSQIDLAWQDVTSNETGFELYRSTSGAAGVFVLFAQPSLNTTSFSDGGLTPTTEYCYRARIFRITGRKTSYSAFSNTSCTTTHDPPPGPTPPSALNARPVENHLNTAFVTWQDNSSDEESFRLERATTDQGPWVQLVVHVANTTSHTEYNLPLEQLFCYRVVAPKGVSASISNVDCTSFPASPTDLKVTAVSGAAVELAWTDNSAHEDGFSIERGENQWTFASVGTTSANGTTFVDDKVAADKTYWYRVGVTREGVRTGLTNTVQAITASMAPSAPTGLSAQPSGSAGVSVRWSEGSTNESGFRVERSENGGAGWAEAGITPNPGFFDPERTSDQQVCYRAIAFNAFGDSPPSNTDCTAPPLAPTDLVATTALGPAIELTWSDNSGVEDGYLVQRKLDYCSYYYCYGYYEEIARPAANATTYRDEAVSPGYVYVYLVSAVKDEGYSDGSNEAAAWSDFPPAAPSNLTALAVSGTQIDLAWSDNTTDEYYFIVGRCHGSATTCANGYFAEVAYPAANATTFSDTNLQASTTYTYRVFAYRSRYSDPSNDASATTPP